MIHKRHFGQLPDGTNIEEYCLISQSGVSVSIISYGAIVTSIITPDRNGLSGCITLGFENLDGYIADQWYLGAIVGRYGNRIKGGRCVINGQQVQLSVNDGKNHLHGGFLGLHKRVWNAAIIRNGRNPGVELTYLSKDGEEGYPGETLFTVVYSLTADSQLVIDYTAVSDKDTIVNPTHHSYFNLSGSPEKTILDHLLLIHADQFTETDESSIPTGTLISVQDTPMDFRSLKRIGEHILENYSPITSAKGYDHNFVLNNYDGTIHKAALLHDPSTGRYVEVFTDQPGMQFYSGNFLDGSVFGKYNTPINHRTGLCLETQNFPDAPNHKHFPNAVLKAGNVYHQKTIYRFFAK